MDRKEVGIPAFRTVISIVYISNNTGASWVPRWGLRSAEVGLCHAKLLEAVSTHKQLGCHGCQGAPIGDCKVQGLNSLNGGYIGGLYRQGVIRGY